MEINILLVAAAAFIGAMATALSGWAEQNTDFDIRKFLPSLIRSLVAAVGIAVAMDYSNATVPLVYLFAFLSGAGVEVGGNRIAGAIAARNK
jgi:hypothetical protein